MGILSSLYTGVSGMTAQGEALGVIGDNIANSRPHFFAMRHQRQLWRKAGQQHD